MAQGAHSRELSKSESGVHECILAQGHSKGTESPLRSQLASSPPSSKLVYYVLAHDGPATPSQLAEETLLPARTVRSGLDTLEEPNLAVGERYVPDARKTVYYALAP